MPRRDYRFQNLLAQLRSQIEHAFSPGERLPTTRELGEMHEIGARTVERALKVLSRERRVKIVPRVGSLKAAGQTSPRRRRKQLTVGLLTRRLAREWPNQEIYAALLNEARDRDIRVVDVPNPQRARPTIKRNQINLSRVPWNAFDVGLLVEAEDTIRLRDPRLMGRRVLAVDQDATAYGLDSIAFDDVRAGATAARHLLGLGHLRFAVTEESNDPGFPCDPAWTARRLGFESALAEAGGSLPPQNRLLVPRRGFNTSPERTEQIVAETAAAWAKLPADVRPTALFTLTTHALILNKLVDELARHRIRVPHDLSIVATAWSGLEPGGSEVVVRGRRYTSITFDLHSLTRRVFDAAIQLGNEKPRRGNQPHIPKLFPVNFAFVPGESTAPPPKPPS